MDLKDEDVAGMCTALGKDTRTMAACDQLWICTQVTQRFYTNLAASFWAGFASHSKTCLPSHPPHGLYLSSPDLTPQTHRWVQVPLVEER